MFNEEIVYCEDYNQKSVLTIVFDGIVRKTIKTRVQPVA